jgi:transcription-repair coupling factor (superfamily II helicase)
MYMKLLEEAVRELKGEDIEDDVRATVNLRVDLTIDEAYVPEMNQRLMIYRKVAEARTERELESSLAGIRDRYGAPPESVLNLAEYGRIRVLADHLGVETIDREGRLVVIKFRPRAKVDPTRLIKVVHEHPEATLVPPGSLKLDLEAAMPGSRKGAAAGRAGAAGTSWWTSRATTGTVTAGFTKEEVLRRPEASPRAPGGMFSRLEELLRALG